MESDLERGMEQPWHHVWGMAAAQRVDNPINSQEKNMEKWANGALNIQLCAQHTGNRKGSMRPEQGLDSASGSPT